MQAVPNGFFGASTFGNPGGSHVVIGSDGSITGYYSDGRKAYDLVPGTNAAITSYTDSATPASAALANGELDMRPLAGQLVSLATSPFNGSATAATMLFSGSDSLGDLYNASLRFLPVVDNDGVNHSRVALKTDTWHTPTPSAGWALGSSASVFYQGVQYTVDALNNLIIVGAIHRTGGAIVGSNTAANTLFFLDLNHVSLSPFIWNDGTGGPTHTNSTDGLYSTEWKRLNVNGSQVSLINTGGTNTGDNYYLNMSFPLNPFL